MFCYERLKKRKERRKYLVPSDKKKTNIKINSPFLKDYPAGFD